LTQDPGRLERAQELIFQRREISSLSPLKCICNMAVVNSCELVLLQESSTDDREEENKMGASFSGSRKSSTSPPSPEAYESSPMTDRKYYSPRFVVTSI